MFYKWFYVNEAIDEMFIETNTKFNIRYVDSKYKMYYVTTEQLHTEKLYDKYFQHEFTYIVFSGSAKFTSESLADCKAYIDMVS